MACIPIKFPGGTGVVCGVRPARRVPCAWCYRPHSRLCDYPLGAKTCDAKMCDKHADARGALDFCPNHASALLLPGLG